MMRKCQVRFLGEGRGVIPEPYPTTGLLMATFIVLRFRFALFISRSSVDKNTSALLRSALAIWVASYPENPIFTSS